MLCKMFPFFFSCFRNIFWNFSICSIPVHWFSSLGIPVSFRFYFLCLSLNICLIILNLFYFFHHLFLNFKIFLLFTVCFFTCISFNLVFTFSFIVNFLTPIPWLLSFSKNNCYFMFLVLFLKYLACFEIAHYSFYPFLLMSFWYNLLPVAILFWGCLDGSVVFLNFSEGFWFIQIF